MIFANELPEPLTLTPFNYAYGSIVFSKVEP
jgi:hypothetical protein